MKITHCLYKLVLTVLTALSVTAVDAGDSEIIRLVQQATFKPITTADLDAARRTALADTLCLEERLGKSDNALDWRSFLGLEQLKTQVLQDTLIHAETAAFPPQIQEALDFSRQRLIGGHEGLETPQVINLRGTLRRLDMKIDLFLNQQAKEQEFNSALSEINSALSIPNDSQTQCQRLEAAVAWLDYHDQAPDLVQNLKAQYAQPNVVISISDSSLVRMTERDVYEVEPIDECEDGRHITGEAIATGKAYLRPVGGFRQNECEIVFNGQIGSTLRGSEGPVSFQLIGQTSISARRPVLLSANAFLPLASLPSAYTTLRTDRICTLRNGVAAKLVRRVAARVIEKEQPEARQDLNEKTADKFLEQFEEDIDKELLDGQNDFREDVLNPLLRMDLSSHPVTFHATPQHLKIHMRLDGGYGLAAPSIPPAVGQHGDINISLHETTINRLADHLLAGEEISDITGLTKQLGLELDEETLASLPTDIAIQFASQKPLTVEFADSILKVTIRGQKFRVGRAVLVSMNAIIRYRVSHQNGRMRLTMEGEPEVVPPEQGKSMRFIAQRRVLVDKLKKELPREEFVEPFDLPSPADKLGKLGIEFTRLADGWLQLSLEGSVSPASRMISGVAVHSR